MRRTTESRRNTAPDREQVKPQNPVRSPGTAVAGRRRPLLAGSPGALQPAIGNAAVARMIERGEDGVCAGQGRSAVQAFGGGDASRPGTVREAARTAGRGGSRLPDGVRTTMEKAFGTTLDHVRVSVDEQAAASIDAKAYTVGSNIVVQSASVLRDVETMAHEIHHTTQRDAPAGLSNPDGRWEREASDVGARVARGQSVHRCAADGEEHEGDGVHRAAIQRRVGFEFESQWRVRDHNNLTAEDEQNYQNEVSERDAVRGTQVLATIAERRYRVELRDDTEKAMSAADLKSRWLAPVAGGNPDEYQLTAEGRARLGRLRQEASHDYDELMATVELPLLGKKLIRETPIRGRDVPKMGSVGGGKNYRLTSDVSPTGGSGLEWVTDPLSTRDDVVEVMDAITRVSAAMDARQNEESFLLEDVQVEGFEGSPGFMVFPLRGALLYEPQMTGGFKLDELPRLLEYLQVPNKAPHILGRSAHEQRREAKQDLHRTTVGTANSIRQSAEAQAKRLPQESIRGESTDGLVGLITLIGSYLSYGSDLEINPNSKSIAGGLMSRTSFAHNFTLLPHSLRMYFREDPNRFAAFALKATGLPEDGNDQLYSRAVEHGDAGHREQREIPLTRAEWLKGIPVGKDLLRNYKHLTEAEKNQVGDRKDDWDHIHGSLGALGSVDDRVGRSGKEEVALVAELRRMKADLHTADLMPLALAAYDLIQRLNEGRSLKYEKARG
ncbi:DUF4157 domain-containing protein [Streptomyces sp. ME02-8801-2C]|uniref:eCIS core domain-containing protein n=1 Tax=Streptomyces sp. ME02-8801-2C TaxID=3028680 RepID=UPI0029BD9C8A|nr:DUF4157 domain-containing protein [Streptomyces sp. ME02-8801-2C]MDX3452121.1 DUF4157 domain-containing protein [Streptomyces sp. ME02-8801-2C]